MVVTLKKVVRSDLFCLFCAFTLGKDRVRIFWENAVDIDVTEFSLIDLSSVLRTVASDSIVVENYFNSLIF